MSHKIYFTESRANKNIRWYAVRLLTELYRRIAPSHAAKRLRKLLLKPHRSSPLPTDNEFKEYRIRSEYGDLISYEIGDGPCILFIHGWSGSGQQFFPLMKSMSQLGFKSISFDHLAHGRSDYHEANLPLLIKGIKLVEAHFKLDSNLIAVVSHSLGSVASLNVFSNSNTPQFLIAPIFDFIDTFFQLVLNTGVTPILLNNLLMEIESEHDMKFSELNINDRVSDYKGPIEIVHDSRDRFSKYALSQQTVQKHPHIKLHTTNDYGHMSILAASDTNEKLKSFIDTRHTP